jgi:hypothetical protein
MKFLLAIPMFFLISCGGEEETQKSPLEEHLDKLEEEQEVITDFIEKDPPAAGSTKELLLGEWHGDSNLVDVSLTKDRYVSYIDGEQKNWDNDWELSSGEELTADNQDDNGIYIHVISEEDGLPFYSFEILELDEAHLLGLVVGSTGEGPYDHIYWSRK